MYIGAAIQLITSSCLVMVPYKNRLIAVKIDRQFKVIIILALVFEALLICDNKMVTKGGPPRPTEPCIAPPITPVISNARELILPLISHPEASIPTSKRTNIAIVNLMKIESTDIRMNEPVGIPISIPRIISEILLNSNSLNAEGIR